MVILWGWVFLISEDPCRRAPPNSGQQRESPARSGGGGLVGGLCGLDPGGWVARERKREREREGGIVGWRDAGCQRVCA